MIFNPRLIIPESFEQCFTYETQIAFLARWVGQLADQIGGGGSPELKALTQRVAALEASDASIENEIIIIKTALTTLQRAVNEKQDTLTFDETPTEGSSNPVTSGGIKKYVDEHSGGGGGTTITIDPTPTEGSENAVSSGGTYDAIQSVKTAAESAASTASAAQSAAATAQSTASGAQTTAEAAQSAAEAAQSTASAAQSKATSADTRAAAAQTTANEALAGLEDKQNTLTFDSTPTAGSNNPVTSDGIKRYVDEHSGGGGTAVVKPNRSLKIMDLSYVIDSDGYVQSVDYEDSLLVYQNVLSGSPFAMVNGITLEGAGDTSPGVAAPLITSRHFGYLNIAPSGAADMWAQGNGTNNANASTDVGTSPIVATILRGARYTVTTSDGSTVWTSEILPASLANASPRFGTVSEVALSTPYTRMCSNGVTLFGYRTGFIDVLDPTDWTVIQSVAISDIPLAIRHTGCHLIAICATQCISYPSGLFSLGTPVNVFTEHYPAAVFDSRVLNAGEGWVCVQMNSGPVVVTESGLLEDMVAAPWQGGVSITSYYGTSVHLYDFPGGHQLASDSFGANSYHMPARRW